MREDEEGFDESEDGDAETEATVVCPHCSNHYVFKGDAPKGHH